MRGISISLGFSASQILRHLLLFLVGFATPATALAETGSINAADYEAYGYDTVGNRTSLRKRDGLTLAYQYDDLDRMTRKTVPDRAGLAATHERDVFYGYNVLDLTTYARFDSAAGEGIANSYDAFGRLLSSTSNMNGVSRAVTRSRDDVNNRTNVTYGGQTYRYDFDAAGRLSTLYQGTGTTTVLADLDYTPRGLPQLRGDGVASSTAYGYDPIGRLTSVTHAPAGGTGNVTFGLPICYDPLGRLYEIGAATPSRRLLWDGDALVAEYQTITGTPLAARFVHGTAAGVDDPLIWFGGGENRRLHADHQGSVVAITNGSGAQTWLNAYDEWGIPNATNSGRFQYTGQAWFSDLGMYHYKARIYSPSLGRFLQVDPVGYDDQVSLYAYVRNDRVNEEDPTGACFENCPGS